MTRILVDIGQTVSSIVPPWAMPFVLGAVALVLLPPWFESVRSKQIKGAIRRMVRAEPSLRQSLAERALHLAGTRRIRLLGLVQEAHRYGQHELLENGLKLLAQSERGRADAQRIRDQYAPAPPVLRDPLEAVVRVESLLQQGLVVAAREQLDAAVRKFPNDPDLKRLENRVAL